MIAVYNKIKAFFQEQIILGECLYRYLYSSGFIKYLKSDDVKKFNISKAIFV